MGGLFLAICLSSLDKKGSFAYNIGRICGVRSSVLTQSTLFFREQVFVPIDKVCYCNGKFEAARCGTHLLKAGWLSVEVRHRRIFLNIIRSGFYTTPFLITSS